jgi:molybdate transport system substrate-binding protein
MLRRSRWLLALLALLALVSLVAAGCGGDDDSASTASSSTTSTSADSLTGDLQVFAASSLTEAFTAMGSDFHAAHPNVKVTFSFAASSALAQQVNDGGPADILVTADASNMKKVTDAGNATDAKTIARNRLAILVGKGNPKGITSLSDLATSGVVFVLCAPEVPCGKFGAAALAKANVTAKPASLEENVKAVVAKVTLGEADAGIVYVTDVKAAAGKAQGVDIDIADDPSLEAVYPIAVTKQARNADAARAWIDYVLSSAGQRTLASYGFLAP